MASWVGFYSTTTGLASGADASLGSTRAFRPSRLILQPRNRIYERRFYRDLRRDAEVRQRLFPDLPPLKLPRRLNLVQFDDLYTGPRNGFAGAIDYYSHSSAFRFVPHIPVPTLLLTARAWIWHLIAFPQILPSRSVPLPI